MSILRSLERRGADPTLPWGSSYIPTNGQIGLVAAGVPMNDDAALSISIVYTCIAILTDSVSSLPLNALKKTKDRTKKVVDPVPPLIDNPWPEGTQQDWLTQVMFSLLLRGNFYGQIVDRDSRGFATMVQPIHPDQVAATRDRSGTRAYRFNGVPVPLANVVHIPSGMVPPGGFIGLNPVEYMRTGWALASAQEKYAGQFFANSANPSGIITVAEDLTEEEALELRRAWQMNHQGIGNAQSPAVLTGGAEWHQISVSNDDAQFLQSRNLSRDDILSWFRIPQHMAGYQDRTSSWGTGIEQMEIGFVINTLRPWISRIENYLSALLPPNQVARFDLSGRLRGDTLQRYQAYTLALNGAFMNPDEVREREDLPPLPDGLGQKFRVPMNIQTVDQMVDPTLDPSAGGTGGQGGGISQSPSAPPSPNSGTYGADGGEQREDMRVEQHFHYPAPVLEHHEHITVQAAQAPDVHFAPEVNIEPTVVPAPDVRIESPVTVQPAELRVETPVTVNPVVSAPPAPDVHVHNTVEVETPKRSVRRTVRRDQRNNIVAVDEEEL